MGVIDLGENQGQSRDAGRRLGEIWGVSKALSAISALLTGKGRKVREEEGETWECNRFRKIGGGSPRGRRGPLHMPGSGHPE